ncbi:MAG: molybdenum cofactor biosynthesis protein [Myxococcales bacterium]|nr:molybdenum cofactor biosynthesis protein [Myxococcales bacterium]
MDGGVNVAVLAVTVAVGEEPTAKQIIDRLTEAGHRIVAREVVGDSEHKIRAQLLTWIGDPDIDVVVATVGIETESASDALTPLVTKPLRGFSDLFRMLSYEEIGTAAMLVDAEAAQCGSTYVFLLPASTGAIRTALDKILVPQLDIRTKPRNLAMKLRRREANATIATPTKAAVPARTATPVAGVAKLEPKTTTPIAVEAKPKLDATSKPAAAAAPKPAPFGAKLEPKTMPIAVEAKPKLTTPLTGPKLDTPVAKVEPAKVEPPKVESASPPASQKPHKSERTGVDPPPPPPRTRPPTAPPPIPPAAGPRVASTSPEPPPPAAKPAAAISVADELDTPSHRRDSPMPLPLIRPSVIVDEVLPPPIIDESARVVPSHAVTTGTIGTIGDINVFTGDSFSQLKKRSARKNWFLWLGLGLATATSVAVFATVQARGNHAVAASNHAEHVAARAKLPDSKPAEPAEPRAQLQAVPAPVKTREIAKPSATKSLETKHLETKHVDETSKHIESPKHVEPPKHLETDPSEAPDEAADQQPSADSAASQARPDPVETKPVADGCDEVSCVLDHYDRPCCTRFKPAGESLKPRASLPEQLDHGMVIAGMEKMKPVVIRCGEKWAVTGTVKLAISVDADGHVTDVTVAATPDPGLGNCVSAAIRKATFGKTQGGGSFKYPFAF